MGYIICGNMYCIESRRYNSFGYGAEDFIVFLWSGGGEVGEGGENKCEVTDGAVDKQRKRRYV